MLFSIFGSSYNIDQGSILRVANDNSPEQFDGRHKYFVRIQGQRYPIKQLLAGATSLNNIEFTAQYAHRILTKLGFDVEELGPLRPRPHFKSDGNLPLPIDSTGIANPLPANGTHADLDLQTRAKLRKFAVVLEQDEDGFIFASCPALPGCHSQGRTRREALNNVAEAIRGYAASMLKHQEEVPDGDWEVVEVSL